VVGFGSVFEQNCASFALAHELGHIALGHQLIDTKFAFADRLMIPDGELLGTAFDAHDRPGRSDKAGHFAGELSEAAADIEHALARR
jgi:hypothetical protein